MCIRDSRRYGSECDPLGRLALHAFKLCFYHPVTKELMEFETPYPTAFKGLMPVSYTHLIEYVPEAIEDAKVNSAINGIDNTLFYAGDMKDILTPVSYTHLG